MSREDASLTPEDEDMILAAEYLLGLLDPRRHADMSDRVAREPAMQALVAAWAEDFAAMTDDLDEAEVPGHVWQAIRDRIRRGEGRADRGDIGVTVPGFPLDGGDDGADDADMPERGEDADADAAFDPADDDTPTGWKGFIASLGITELVLGTAAAALLAFFAWDSDLMQPRRAPDYAAEIGAAGAAVRFTAVYDEDTGTLEVQRDGMEAQPGRSYQLWMLAGDAQPVPLMVWQREAENQRVVLGPEAAEVMPGATLAVSDEPFGGSPTGLPTGEVLATGAVSSI